MLLGLFCLLGLLGASFASGATSQANANSGWLGSNAQWTSGLSLQSASCGHSMGGAAGLANYFDNASRRPGTVNFTCAAALLPLPVSSPFFPRSPASVPQGFALRCKFTHS